MRRPFVALPAGMMAAAIGGAAFAFPNEPDGFLGLKWGQNVADVPGMACTGWQSPTEDSIRTFNERFDYKVYERKDEEIRIGSVPVSGIPYIAWQGRLRGVLMALNPRVKDEILKILASRFGKSRQERRDGHTVYGWTGERTTMELVEAFKTLGFRLNSTRLANEERKNRHEHSVRRLREKEALDRRAVEQGEGF